jgi:hypothetical protein
MRNKTTGAGKGSLRGRDEGAYSSASASTSDWPRS